MCDLTEAAAELRRIEQMVAEQFASIAPPKAPDVRRCVDEMRELEPTNPHTRAGTALIAVLATACLLAGVYF